jgi:hypothetical protein
MNWSAVGAIGELLGAAAVVLTLAYLARQIRDANRLAKAEAYRAVRALHVNISGDWAKDREWLMLWARLLGGARREELSHEERMVAATRYDQLLAYLAAIHHEVELGILPISAYKVVGKRQFDVPYMSDVWPLLRGEYPESFASFFESYVSLAPSDSLERLPLAARGRHEDE